METNSSTPIDLANRVLKAVKRGVSASLEVCETFAEAWSHYIDGAWNNDEIKGFLNTLHQNNIGPNPDTLKLDLKDRYFLSSSAASFFIMKTVGEHLIFKDLEVREACLINSRSSLYHLTRFYDAAFEYAQGSSSKKGDKARTLIIKLLSDHGEGLTRDIIVTETNLLKRVRQSHKPLPPTPTPLTVNAGRSSVKEAVANGTRFNKVLLTPSKEVLDAIKEMSLEAILERYDYSALLDDGAVISIVVSGDRLDSVLRLNEALMIETPTLYCVRSTPDKKPIIDLANEILVFGNQSMDVDAKLADGETVEGFLRRTMSKNANGPSIHLFAETQSEDWVSCVGDEDSCLGG